MSLLLKTLQNKSYSYDLLMKYPYEMSVYTVETDKIDDAIWWLLENSIDVIISGETNEEQFMFTCKEDLMYFKLTWC